MTASRRPNLGGLFNGSTPPEQSSSIAGAFGPKYLKQLPADGSASEVPLKPARSGGLDAAETPATDSDELVTDTEALTGPSERWTVPGWVDPTKIVLQYFAFLQVLLDTNRDLAVALTSTVMSLSKRGHSR